MNNLKAFALMSGLSILLVLLGSAVGGTNGAAIFFLISLGMNLFSYYYSDKMVIKMTKAQEIEESKAPRIYAMIRKLTSRAGIPMPKIYVTHGNSFHIGIEIDKLASTLTDYTVPCNTDLKCYRCHVIFTFLQSVLLFFGDKYFLVSRSFRSRGSTVFRS